MCRRARARTAGPVHTVPACPWSNPLEIFLPNPVPIAVHMLYRVGMRNGSTDTYRVSPYADSGLVMPDQTWDTAALQREFTVRGFLAPYVVVVRKSDGVTGTLTFTHNPRVYSNFVAD